MQHIELNGTRILVTGSAGFIGARFVERLLDDVVDAEIVGLDDLNDYYSPKLKEYRLARVERVARRSRSSYAFARGSIADASFLDSVFGRVGFDVVVNLAAQAGVRYGAEHPEVYVQSNLVGFVNLLEACRRVGTTRHLVYASSSSVYGGGLTAPFKVGDPTDSPYSLYAATKKSNELLAHAYGKLYDLPSTGLRFFTVYGPAGRPDMFYYSAAKALIVGARVKLFNRGNCLRDFTYVDDVAEAIKRAAQNAPERRKGDDGLPIPPCAVYNVGRGRPESALALLDLLQTELARVGAIPENQDCEALRDYLPMQPGDVPTTCADVEPFQRDFGFAPTVDLKDGLRKFAEWLKEYGVE